MAAAATLIASCGEQPSPTVASPVAAPAGINRLPQEPALLDMLADPTEPTFSKTAVEAYPPGTAYSPWPPGPPPKAQPGVPVPSNPTTTPRMHIVIDPEPVAHSGAPIPTVSCATNHPFTWYYDQVLINDTGLALTLTQRENFFDGRYTSTNPEVIQIRGNGTVRITTRWCSGYPKPHYTQTRFKGRDETGEPIEISGPWVRLLTP